MRSLLKYIRQQPKTTRNHYALALAAMFTGAVGMVWLFTNAASNIGNLTASGQPESNAPFSNLIKQTKEQWAGVRGSLQDSAAPEETASSSESVPQDPRTLILTPAEIEEASQPPEREVIYATRTSSTTTEETDIYNTYMEVQIATTTKATSSTYITP